MHATPLRVQNDGIGAAVSSRPRFRWFAERVSKRHVACLPISLRGLKAEKIGRREII